VGNYQNAIQYAIVNVPAGYREWDEAFFIISPRSPFWRGSDMGVVSIRILAEADGETSQLGRGIANRSLMQPIDPVKNGNVVLPSPSPYALLPHYRRDSTTEVRKNNIQQPARP
jgi:hypothetical protein